MKLTYDPKQNIAYLAFREGGTELQSLRLSDDLIIDIAADGTLYGIEFLNANDQLKDGVVTIQNEATGHHQQVRIAG